MGDKRGSYTRTAQATDILSPKPLVNLPKQGIPAISQRSLYFTVTDGGLEADLVCKESNVYNSSIVCRFCYMFVTYVYKSKLPY